mmetsp:Transcript_27944/g.79021  ORF Transcript_27944/g.79021 Transcript_27944/m.79021 type:complete len:780 (-) Transcript_27944:219-2558(-)
MKSEVLSEPKPVADFGRGWQVQEDDESEPYRRIIVRGGYQDVDLASRSMSYCYWPGAHHRILRGTWFVERGDGQWNPVMEHIADQLEDSYQSRVWANRISRKRDCGVEGVRVDLKIAGSNSMYALFASHREIYLVLEGPSRVWNYMTGAKPGSPLRRGWVYEKITDYNERCQMRTHDSYTPGSATALLLATHGIGQLMPGSNIADDVSRLRETIAKAAEQAPHERHEHVEVLPIQWRKNLQLDVDAVAAKIMPKTIEALRSRVHETAVEVLLYLTPLHHRDFVSSLTYGLNDVYRRFMRRNPSFKGKISIVAHSLGSVISYDILCHQPDLYNNLTEQAGEEPDDGGSGSGPVTTCKRRSAADVSEWKTRYDSGGAAAAEAVASMTTRSGLSREVKAKETLLAGLENEVTQLKMELAAMKAREEGGEDTGAIAQGQLSPGEEGKRHESGDDSSSSKTGGNDDRPKGGRVLRHTDTAMYVAEGRGGPMGEAPLAALRYPKLSFAVDSLFLLGSPLGLFLALKGVNPAQGRSLGSPGAKELLPYGGGYGDSLPAVRRMYNIYHPCDPVAYRLEPLAFTGGEGRRPLYMPYRGGKRMHIGTREFFESLGQNMHNATSQTLESVKATTHNALNAMGFKGDLSRDIPSGSEGSTSQAGRKAPPERALPAHRLTDGVEKLSEAPGGADGRLDFILQDGPVDNPYISAIGAHFGYFNCPDTAMFISRAVSGLDVISGTAKVSSPQQAANVAPTLPHPPRPELQADLPNSSHQLDGHHMAGGLSFGFG